MFDTMPDDISVKEMIKNSTPIDIEDPELKKAKEELRKAKALNIDQQIEAKFGSLKLYMDLFIEWKIAQARNQLVFIYEWGKLKMTIEIFERDGSGLCPIMEFQEFCALLIIAYKHF